MKLFTASERDVIKQSLIDELKQFEEVISVIIVGSGAIGFTDELSDLDFSIVLENNSDIESVMKRLREFITVNWNLIDSFDLLDRKLQVFMLDNFLEVDIGYSYFDEVAALRERWLVVYDRSNQIDQLMQKSWEINKENHGKKESFNLEKAYRDVADDIWHYLMHSAVAIRRDNLWRAVGEMNIARDMLIELLGYRYSLETKRYRGVDKFPEEVKATLEKTLPRDFSKTAFADSLDILTMAVYDELEHFFTDKNNIVVPREAVRQYLIEVFKLF